MKTKIISPENLQFQTTIPQCTDTQFVSRTLFNKIAGDIALKDLREGLLNGSTNSLIESYRQSTQIEYKRSLLFSRQVVLNRAVFWGSPLIINSLVGENTNDGKGLIELLSQETIVPYLFNEDSFEQQPIFDIPQEGIIAVQSLVRDPDLSTLVCVRLGGDDKEKSEERRDAFTTDFRLQLSELLLRTDVRGRTKRIAAGLIGRRNRTILDSDPQIEKLAVKIEEIAKWVVENKPTRDVLYRQFITMPGTRVSDGIYKKESLTFETKLWIDLIYNSNLPHHLGVFTFIPTDLPTPFDVDLIWTLASGDHASLTIEPDGVLEDILERVQSKATWSTWDIIQKTADLCIPSPDLLTHQDIITIRGWAEWENMMQGMKDYLRAPLEESYIKDYHILYDTFLKRLGSWWLQNHSYERKQWASGVAKIYRVGNWFIGLLTIANQVFPILPPINLPSLPDNEYVEVIVESSLYVFNKNRTDWRRTQVVRNTKDKQKINRDKLLTIWSSLIQLYPDLPNNYPGHDQYGKLATEE
ncbi:MAG: hypothetical protein JW712_06615 [Dehalococcoidales bacterium]|nr:hypothetical protein [Dehalococcoidales bacterium]